MVTECGTMPAAAGPTHRRSLLLPVAARDAGVCADEPEPHHPVFTFILTNYFNTVTPQYNLCVLPLTIYSKLLCINFEVYNSKNFTLQGV